MSAVCVQQSNDSLNSAIHIAYRISLRPSSRWEPRHPSLKVVKVFGFNNRIGDESACAQNNWSFTRFGFQRVNDPSAGSPTETLLRLLLPLSDKVYKTFRNIGKLPISQSE